MKTYSEKLKDPRWQRKRLEIMQRDNFTCQSCGAGNKPLCVHHWKYKGEPWQANANDLQTLCESCHELAEKRIAVLKSGFSGDSLNLMKMVLRWIMGRAGDDGLVVRMMELDTIILASCNTGQPDCVAGVIQGLGKRLDSGEFGGAHHQCMGCKYPSKDGGISPVHTCRRDGL